MVISYFHSFFFNFFLYFAGFQLDNGRAPYERIIPYFVIIAPFNFFKGKLDKHNKAEPSPITTSRKVVV